MSVLACQAHHDISPARRSAPDDRAQGPPSLSTLSHVLHLIGTEKCGTEVLALLNITCDRERSTLELLCHICPPHSEQNHTFGISTETSIALGRCSLERGDGLPVDRHPPGRIASAQGIHPVEPLSHAQSEQLHLEFRHGAQQGWYRRR